MDRSEDRRDHRESLTCGSSACRYGRLGGSNTLSGPSRRGARRLPHFSWRADRSAACARNTEKHQRGTRSPHHSTWSSAADSDARSQSCLLGVCVSSSNGRHVHYLHVYSSFGPPVQSVG